MTQFHRYAFAALLAGSSLCGPAWAQRTELTDDSSRDALAIYDAKLDPEYVNAQKYHLAEQKFMFPADADDASVYGIDVSHYETKIDWSALPAEKVAFVFVKATQGNASYDGTFAKNWAALAALPEPHIYRGAYHFLSATGDPDKESQNFLSTVGKLAPNDMPAVLDMEWDLAKNSKGEQVDRWAAYSQDEIAAHAKTWLDAVEKATGKKPIIYTCVNWWKTRIGNNASLKDYKIWVADYTSASIKKNTPRTAVGYNWVLWQFTDTGHTKDRGPGQDYDTSSFPGKIDQFKAALDIK